MKFAIVSCFVALFCAGCSDDGEPIAAPRGQSPVITAFVDSLDVQAQSQADRDRISGYRAATADVSLAPGAEEERSLHVLRWTVGVYSQAWALAAGVAWSPATALRDAAETARDAEAFATACSDARSAAPMPTWSFDPFEGAMVKAEHEVQYPAEWETTRWPAFAGAWDCAAVIAIRAGAATLGDALVALGPISAELHDAEGNEVQALAAIE